MVEYISRSAAQAAREVKVVIGRLRRRIQELALADDLSLSQTAVLTRLSKEGPNSASTLALAEGVSPQAIAATLSALDRHGLIRRRPDPQDGRRQLITLTKAGIQRAESTRRAREEWLARALHDHLNEEERRTVLRAMEMLDRLTRFE